MKAFAHIFRRENIKAQVIEGDSFHRYNRVEMRERVKAADSGESAPISHFGPEANLLGELADTFAEYGATGRGKVRRYVHDIAESKELGSDPGTFTGWQPMRSDSDLLFYEGLHGGYVGDGVDVARHVDLLVGVVPIINLEWIQKLHRDRNQRGYTQGSGGGHHSAAHARLREPHLSAVQPHARQLPARAHGGYQQPVHRQGHSERR